MLNINRTLTALTFSLFYLTSLAQTDICQENTTGVFWPIKLGVKRNYYAQGGTYVNYFNGDSLKVGENIYYKEIEEYSSGKKREVYYREQDGNVYIYDTEKKIEFLELSNNITPGYTWKKYDKSWKYTVVDTTSSVSTPYCEYNGLLNIKAEPQGETKKNYSSYFNLYYKRGVGLVGMDIEGKGFSFLTIDKSKVNEKSYTALGCENLISEEQRVQCTSAEINEFISKNFSYDGKLRKGVLALRFLINEKGEVKNVSVAQPIKNAEGQTEEAIRIVKLMKFIPRQVNDIPCKTWVAIPINF
jgi:TonB family protein